METLGLMYMMKLRHGDRFGSTANSAWRLIFVFALMPWLRKYRLMTRPEIRKNVNGDEEGITMDSGVSGEMVMLVQQSKRRLSIEKKRRESKTSLAIRRSCAQLSIGSDDEEYQNLLIELDEDILEYSDDESINHDALDEIRRIKVDIRTLLDRKLALEKTILRSTKSLKKAS